MTKNEHLEWAKNRAFALIDEGDSIGAWTSFVSDLQSHKDLEDHIAIELRMTLLMVGGFNALETRKFIDGFN